MAANHVHCQNPMTYEDRSEAPSGIATRLHSPWSSLRASAEREDSRGQQGPTRLPCALAWGGADPRRRPSSLPNTWTSRTLLPRSFPGGHRDACVLGACPAGLESLPCLPRLCRPATSTRAPRSRSTPRRARCCSRRSTAGTPTRWRLHGPGRNARLAARQRPRGGGRVPPGPARRGYLHLLRHRRPCTSACSGCCAAEPAPAAPAHHQRRRALRGAVAAATLVGGARCGNHPAGRRGRAPAGSTSRCSRTGPEPAGVVAPAGQPRGRHAAAGRRGRRRPGRRRPRCSSTPARLGRPARRCPSAGPRPPLSAHKWGGPAGVGVLLVRQAEHAGARPSRSTSVPTGAAPASRTSPARSPPRRRSRPASPSARSSTPGSGAGRPAPAAPYAPVPDVEVHGHPGERLPHLVSFSCLYVDGEALVTELDRAGIRGRQRVGLHRERAGAFPRAGRHGGAHARQRAGLLRHGTPPRTTSSGSSPRCPASSPSCGAGWPPDQAGPRARRHRRVPVLELDCRGAALPAPGRSGWPSGSTRSPSVAWSRSPPTTRPPARRRRLVPDARPGVRRRATCRRRGPGLPGAPTGLRSRSAAVSGSDGAVRAGRSGTGGQGRGVRTCAATSAAPRSP